MIGSDRMRRRDFLKTVTFGAAGVGMLPGPVAAAFATPSLPVLPPKMREDDLKLYLQKVRDFDADHPGDVYLDDRRFRLLESSLQRFQRLQKLIGFGNFYLLDFDDALHLADRHTEVDRFTVPELNFLEQIFYERASLYGFYGEKPLTNLTDRIPRREVVKVPYTGNYLYRGRPHDLYEQIRREVGGKVVLTSGVRSVIKQFLLFLDKAYASNGNLSRASRSLAPPGYSFHGISDFDVGQRGYGNHNFTERFVTSEVFKRLKSLGYLSLRYPRDNMFGVRFEPWHIKVDNRA